MTSKGDFSGRLGIEYSAAFADQYHLERGQDSTTWPVETVQPWVPDWWIGLTGSHLPASEASGLRIRRVNINERMPQNKGYYWLSTEGVVD